MRKKITSQFVVLLGLVLTLVGVNDARAGECGTIVPAGSVVGAHWTLAGSPYCVTGDIDLIGVVIDPGVEVWVDGDYQIEFVGNVTAAGTAEQPILFTEKDEDDNWNGIVMNNAFPPLILDYCIIEQSDSSGIRIAESFPMISNCTVRSNTAPARGGGIYAMVSSGPLILESCFILGNTAYWSSEGNVLISRGGGLYVNGDAEVRHCEFVDNLARSQNAFVTAGRSRGGGVYLENGVHIFENCEFTRNNAESLSCGCQFPGSRRGDGGGAYVRTGTSSFSNCAFLCNTNTGGEGAGVFTFQGGVTLANCTVSSNSATGLGSTEGTLAAHNCIIYFNNSGSTQISGTATVTYSDVENGFDGEGNIDFNPGFYGDDCSCPDFRITPFSPCVDAGSPLEKFNDGCLGPGLGRPTNDMGAHGGPLNCNWDCWNPADLDCDGTVGVKDLLALLGQWGPCPALPDDCPADINCDGTVGVKDLLQLLANWG